MYVDGYSPFFFLATFLVIVAIAVVLGIVIISILRATVGPARTSDDSALRILRERFARGEISQEEFEQARRVLER